MECTAVLVITEEYLTCTHPAQHSRARIICVNSLSNRLDLGLLAIYNIMMCLAAQHTIGALCDTET